MVGGFLGSGKTTLLWEAARRLKHNGQRIGLVTNDQAPELVDTALLSRDQMQVAEVSGSCFCCNFNGLVEAIRQVRTEAEADVIIAEPVGSCTDLSATIFQPLKKNLGRELLVSPLSVMADPVRLVGILNGGNAGLHSGAAYIFRKQLEESDLILISKAELLDANELSLLKERTKQAFPHADVMALSAKSGLGMDEWLTEVMHRTDAGQRLVEVDYDIYAEGEAILGWLNSTLMLTGDLTDWNVFARDLMEGLSQQFDRKGVAVGHVKMMLEAKDQYLVANLTGRNDTLSIRGTVDSGAEARVILNVRVEMSPEALEQLVREILFKTIGKKLVVDVLAWRCLKPGRPNPTFRYDHVVPAF